MVTESVLALLVRGLSHLKTELSAYSVESKLWLTDGTISNSAGNLALHLIGNLKHFIGTTLGQSGFVRNRPAEFEDKDVPRDEILRQIDETILIIQRVLPHLTTDDLNRTYPLAVRPEPVTTMFWLIHLTAHLNYHVGQINYHRRLLDTP